MPMLDDAQVLPRVYSESKAALNTFHGNTGISDSRKVVATAGTREALVASSVPCRKVIIQAETDNTGVIAVGGDSVVAAAATRRGVALAQSESVTIEIDDLQKIYLDATVSGEGVTFAYFT